MPEGLATTEVDLVTIADEVIVNRNGSTSRMLIDDLSSQVAALVQPGLSADMEALAGPYVTAAEGARDQALVAVDNARNAVLMSAGFFLNTAQGIGRGLQGVVVITAGAGGTNGTWPWVASGGVAVVAATGTVTIFGGAVVAVKVDQKGHYTTDPTGITITGAGALAGHGFALTNGVNTPVNGHFSVPIAGSTSSATLYRVDAGPVATAVTTYASSLLDISIREARLSAGLPVTSVKLVEATGSIAPSIYRQIVPTIGAAYELVVHFRPTDGRDKLNLYANGGVSMNVTFDFATGVAVVAATIGTGVARYIGGGWWECVASNTAVSTVAVNLQVRPTPTGSFPFAGDTAKGAFIDKLICRLAGTTANLFPSSDPMNAAFTKVSLTATSTLTPESLLATEVGNAVAISAAVAAVVNGAMTATRLTEATGTNYMRAYKAIAPTVGVDYIVSVDAKGEQRQRLGVYSNAAGFAINCAINLQNGGVAVASGMAAGATVQSEALVGGWWKATLRLTASASPATNLQLFVLDDVSANGSQRSGNGTSGLLIKRVKVETTAGVVLLDATDFSTWTANGLTVTPNAGRYLGIMGSPAGSVYDDGSAAFVGKKIAVVGTSLVAQGNLTNSMASLIAGATIVPLGASGGSLGLASNGHYGSGTVTALFSGIPTDAHAIILDMPVNDFGAASVPLGAVGDTTTATFAGALANFALWCDTNRPNAAVMFVVPTSAGPGHAYSHSAGANSAGYTLRQYQQMVRDVADQYGRPCLDPNRFGLSMLDADENTGDNLHWDLSGGLVAARIYSQFMRDLALTGWLA